MEGNQFVDRFIRIQGEGFTGAQVDAMNIQQLMALFGG